jgi:hypothetical protein
MRVFVLIVAVSWFLLRIRLALGSVVLSVAGRFFGGVFVSGDVLAKVRLFVSVFRAVALSPFL